MSPLMPQLFFITVHLLSKGSGNYHKKHNKRWIVDLVLHFNNYVENNDT